MTALAADRQTLITAGGDQRTGIIGASAGEVLYHGGLLARAADGYGAAAASGGGVVIGITQGFVDNTDGADGDLDVTFTTGRGRFVNGTEAVLATDIGRVCYVQDDQTVAREGTTPAGVVMEVLSDGVVVHVDPILTAAAQLAAQPITATQEEVGVPVVYAFDIPDAATADYDRAIPAKFEVTDVTVLKSVAGAGNTVMVKSTAAAITDAIAAAVDKAVTRAGTIDRANSTIAAGGILRLTVTRAAGSSLMRVLVHGIRRN